MQNYKISLRLYQLLYQLNINYLSVNHIKNSYKHHKDVIIRTK